MYVLNFDTKNKLYIDQFILKNELEVHVIGLRVNGLLEVVYVWTLLLTGS